MMIFTINTGVSDYRFITVMATMSAVIHRQAALELEEIKTEPTVIAEEVGKADDCEELA